MHGPMVISGYGVKGKALVPMKAAQRRVKPA